MVAKFVGQGNAQFVLCLMQGVLLQRLFDGRQCSFQDIEAKLLCFLKTVGGFGI